MAKDDIWRPTFPDLITVGALVVAAVMWMKQPTWQWALPITVFVIGLVIFTAIRHQSHPIRRAILATFAIGVLVWAAWMPIRDSFSADYPNFAFHWPVTLGEQAGNSIKLELGDTLCSGVLHRADGRLRFGGEAGEGESICLVNKADESKVLATCAVGHSCRVKGSIGSCGDGSGECEEIKKIRSIQSGP